MNLIDPTGLMSEQDNIGDGVSDFIDSLGCMGRSHECSQRGLRDTSGDWKTAPEPKLDKKETTKVNPSTVGRIARTFGLCLLTSSICGLSKQYVTLYRAVNDEELAIIQSTGTYGFNPNGSGKYFAQSEQGARNIRSSFPSNNTITRIQVPTSTLYAGTNFNDTGGAGPSVHYADTQLPVVYSTMTPIQILQE